MKSCVIYVRESGGTYIARSPDYGLKASATAGPTWAVRVLIHKIIWPECTRINENTFSIKPISEQGVEPAEFLVTPKAPYTLPWGRCRFWRCKNKAEGYHCKGCDTPVCKEHQAPSGFGNHGSLTGEIKLIKNDDWRRIE